MAPLDSDSRTLKTNPTSNNSRRYALRPVGATALILTLASTTGCGEFWGSSLGILILVSIAGLVVASRSFASKDQSSPHVDLEVERDGEIDDCEFEQNGVISISITTSWDQQAEATAGQWVFSEQPFNLRGRTIPRPMLYVGKCPKDAYPDAAMIDPSWTVAKHVGQNVPEMGYWPSYRDMRPQQRLVYLRWLEGGRVDPNIQIGYVFVFYYGLERRLLVDGLDVQPIVTEVKRLRGIHADNGSFAGYSERLLAFVGCRDLSELAEEELGGYFPRVEERFCDEDTLNAVLAWHALNKRPLHWEWGLRIAQQDPRSPSSVIVNRVSEEFRDLFQRRYQEQFPSGLFLKTSKRPRRVTYHPASATLSARANSDQGRAQFETLVPDALRLTSQFKPLVELYSNCIEDLRAFSRAKSKASHSEDLTAAAWEKLPPELRENTEHPDHAVWSGIVADHAGEGTTAYVPVGNLATANGLEHRTKLTTAQASKIAETASFLGYGVEPDPRLTRCGWAWDGKVAVFHEEQPNQHLRRESPYGSASVLLRLSLSIAVADGDACRDEIETVERFMENQFMLSPSEKKRLEALGNILLQGPISLAGVGKRIVERLDENQRRQVGQFLIAVAAVDGVFQKSEIAALKRAYRSIGLDPQEAVHQVNRMCVETGAKVDEPVVVRRGREARPGEPIPAPPPVDAPVERATVSLDRRAIAKILVETQAVSQLLGQVLAVEDEEEEHQSCQAPPPSKAACASSVPPESSPDSSEARIAGVDVRELDPRYQELLAQLLTQKAWDASSLRDVASRCGVMPAGAIESINEWSDEELGDFLIEGEGPYTINRQLLGRRS
jgi:uncharacterized tellurite resistance protein B-like protein